MNQQLSPSDLQDICAAMAGLAGPHAQVEARSLAAFYGVTATRIYEISRRVRPQRVKRSDTGRRRHDLMGTDALKFAAELVVNQNLAPELALLVMRENADKFGEVEITTDTFRRLLREHGISRTQARANRAPHRTFEADFPGQIFQFDISGVKERWVDIKTRAIHKVSVLEVSKNHQNRRLDRVPLWKFTVVDDKSRKKFVRFVACSKPNTVHVVDFLREAFLRLGLPVMLYTDNDSVIVNKRTLRGARFLNEAFKASGGFELLRHMPGNPQATGKVERAHRIVEEYEKLIGVKIEFGNQPHIDALNRFADWIAARYNARPHSVTGVSPDVAFRATTNPFRQIDPGQFDAAFKARDLSLRVGRDVTIVVDGVRYQLSRRDADPFNLLAETGQKLEVYWLDEEEFFACVTPSGEEYVVEKITARADRALDYRTLPETRAEKTRKELQRSQKERIRKLKEGPGSEEGPTLDIGLRTLDLVIPGLDVTAEPSNVAEFPRAVEPGNRGLLDQLTHRNHAAHPLDLFDALDLLQREGLAPTVPGDELSEIKERLKKIFAGRETIGEPELREVLDGRKLRAAG